MVRRHAYDSVKEIPLDVELYKHASSLAVIFYASGAAGKVCSTGTALMLSTLLAPQCPE